jgi:hypothetical protein
MRALAYLAVILLLLLPSVPVRAETEPQQAGINARGVVEGAEISGIPEDELSQDIRDAVRKLIGQPFDQQAADELVMRIQMEKPEFTATTRLLQGNQTDRVRVVFFLEKNDGNVGADSNVNSRYTVERVEIEGYDESKLSSAIRDDMKKMVGEKLDQDKANQIRNRLDDELRPRHSVKKRIAKGSDRQHIVVIYEILTTPWIPFVAEPLGHILYHSKQNFSAAFSANLHDTKTNRLYVGFVNDQDQLIERYAGFNLGFEMTKVGTDRLGLALRYARFHDRWQPSTVSEDQNAIYRERSVFDPTITFAFDPRLRLTAGVSLSDLQMQYPTIHNVNANAAVASLTFHNVWGKTDGDQDLHALRASYDFSAGNHELDSEFIYTRHLVNAQYAYGHHRNQLLVRFSAGTIAGNAPLFERFSLGDTVTLRGWNKFDITPFGGNRMMHATVQYGINGPRSLKWVFKNDKGQLSGGFGVGFHVFYDTGVVGDHGSPMKVRHSVGFGFGPSGSDGFFIGMGFPIRSSRVQPIFMMGFRF